MLESNSRKKTLLKTISDLEVRVEGKGAGVILRGEASAAGKKSATRDAVHEIREQYGTGLPATCDTIANRIARSGPPPPPKPKVVAKVAPKVGPKVEPVNGDDWGDEKWKDVRQGIIWVVTTDKEARAEYDAALALNATKYVALKQAQARVGNGHKGNPAAIQQLDWYGETRTNRFLVSIGQ